MSEEADDATVTIGSNLKAIHARPATAAASPPLQDGNLCALLDTTRTSIQYDERINYLDRDDVVPYTTDERLAGGVGSGGIPEAPPLSAP